MRKAFVFLILILIQKLSYSQNNISSSYLNSSYVISLISKEWKEDSLAINGFRLSIFKQLRNSRVDTITKESLFEKLGKPIQSQKFFDGNKGTNYVQYIYYYFNNYLIDKTYEILFISFIFDEDEKSLQYIEDGMYCG